MNNIIMQLEKKYMKRALPVFSIGDTVIVQIKIQEKKRVRLQSFEGVVISMRHRGLHSAFTVRKMSYGVGVEYVFPIYSPIINKVIIKYKGIVRRAKLYYLRNRTGKAARIKRRT